MINMNNKLGFFFILCWITLINIGFLRTGTVAAESQLPSKADLLVEGLEDVEPAFSSVNGTMYAGLIPFDYEIETSERREGEIMFWLFNSPTPSDSLVLWLNGGPGCSSFSAGLIMEHGPVMIQPRPAGYCCAKPDEPLKPNPYGWARRTNVLYVEQPIGTGFSQGSSDHDEEPKSEDDIAKDFHAFLQNFFKTFPELLPKKFFVFGESYAGMYVPSIAREIHLQNKKIVAKDSSSRENLKVNLHGIALGNGWIDAKIQGKAVIDYAFWHGMIDSITRSDLHEHFKSCIATPSTPDSPLHPFTTPDECGTESLVLKAAGAGLIENRSPNTYDVTTWDTYPFINSDIDNSIIETFYNDPRVKKAIHAPSDVYWRGCIPGSGRRRRRRVTERNLMLLDNDRPLSMAPYLAELMDEAKIRVLIYNGDRDLSVNGPGTENVLNGMVEWTGHQAWMDNSISRRGLWISNYTKEVAGYSKQHDRLTFLTVSNSGHLVPYNLPEVGLELMLRFISDTSFLDKEIKPIEFSTSPTTDTDASSSVSTPQKEEYFHSHSSFGTMILSSLAGLTIGLCIGIAVTWDYLNRRRRTGYEAIKDEP